MSRLDEIRQRNKGRLGSVPFMAEQDIKDLAYLLGEVERLERANLTAGRCNDVLAAEIDKQKAQTAYAWKVHQEYVHATEHSEILDNECSLCDVEDRE